MLHQNSKTYAANYIDTVTKEEHYMTESNERTIQHIVPYLKPQTAGGKAQCIAIDVTCQLAENMT